MRESRTYGSGRGACHEMHVPTATKGREFITVKIMFSRLGMYSTVLSALAYLGMILWIVYKMH